MTTIGGVDVRGPVQGRFSEILTPEALAFLASLQEVQFEHEGESHQLASQPLHQLSRRRRRP